MVALLYHNGSNFTYTVTRACANIYRFDYVFVLTGYTVLQLAPFSAVALLPLANNAVHSPTNSENLTAEEVLV